MRGRLTLAFVCLALLIAIIGGAIRADALRDLARTSSLNQLTYDAEIVAALVEDLAAADVPITSSVLQPYVPDETELTVERQGSRPLTVEGNDYDQDVPEDAPEVRATVGDTTVSIVQDASVVADQTRESLITLLALIVALLLMVAISAYAMAKLITRPFRQLAESAAALGRGRFDFVAPKSRIPEVVSIATSLETSASQLQDFLRRDREFFQHASHALRTPLTAMSLGLEELTLRDDLSVDAQGAAIKCLSDARRLDTTVTELLAFARARSLVAGAEVSLLTLGSHVAQRWRDRLPDSRVVKAYVDGGPEFTLTPGPVEQLLDSVLRDVAENGSGQVTLRFAGQEEHVKVTVRSGPGGDEDVHRPTAQVPHTIADVLGGRCTGDATAGGLEILLPRR